MSKQLSLTLGQYLLMSETHIRNLVAQGFEVVIEDNAKSSTKVEPKAIKPTTSYEVKKPASKEAQPKVAKATKNKPAAKAAKSKAKASSSSKKNKKKLITFGNVRKDDYFAVYNKTDKNNPVLVKVGYANEVKDGVVTVFTSKDGKEAKKYSLDYCSAISKAKFDHYTSYLAKKQNKKGKTEDSAKSTNIPAKLTRLAPREYTRVLAYLAKKTNSQIDYVELVNSNITDDELKQVREQIHKDLPDLKLGAKQALEIYENEVLPQA